MAQSAIDVLAYIVFSCLLFAPFSSSGQLLKEQPGPGLDATPLRIPLVKPSAPRPITNLDLLEMRDLRGLSISPDATQIAFVVSQAVLRTNAYRTALFVVSTEPGSVPVSYGTVGPPFWSLLGQWLPEAPQWSPDSQFITYRSKSSGSWQVWRWSKHGGEPIQLTHSPRDVQKYRWSPDGTKIIYEVYPPHDPAMVKQLSEEGLLLAEDIEKPWDIGTPIVDAKLDTHTTPPQTWMFNLANGEERAATVEEQRELSIYITSYDAYSDGTGDGVWSPNHTKLAFIGTSTCGTHQCFPLFVREGKDGPSRVLTPGIYYATDPRWNSDGSQIFFERYDADGRARPAVATLANGSVRDVLTIGNDSSLRDCSWDRSGRYAACSLQDPVTPSRVTFVDANDHSSRVVADLNPEFGNLRLSPAIPINWPNDDEMHAHLVLPIDYERGKRYPLVVTMYRDGSSFLRGAVGDEYPIQVFAAAGLAVLNFDVGTSREFKPGDFESALSMWDAPLQGLQIVINKLDKEGIIDPRRVAITGLSHGAEIAAYAISHSHLFCAAAMSQGGSEDLTGEFLQNGRYAREFWRRMGLVGPDGPILDRWQQISASRHVDDIHSPVLLNESDREYLFFMEFYATLRDHNKPVEVWIYPHEDHEKNQPKHRYIIYNRNRDWLMFWLMGKENSEPSDPGQYARWRELRKMVQP
jgi:dipeptidyl aminopeptidase/acylaminoacyl peptidase